MSSLPCQSSAHVYESTTTHVCGAANAEMLVAYLTDSCVSIHTIELNLKIGCDSENVT